MIRHTVHLLTTPRVVVSIYFRFKETQSKLSYMDCCDVYQEEARRHFNCPILEGMELENQGGAGIEFNHWEKTSVRGTETKSSLVVFMNT